MTQFRNITLLLVACLPWVPIHPRKQAHAFLPPRPPRASALIMPTRPRTAFGVPLTPRLCVFFPTHPRLAPVYPTHPRGKLAFVIPDRPRLVA
jgi:hypothetical protein